LASDGRSWDADYSAELNWLATNIAQVMQAAEAAGLELSAWLRSLGLREAGRTT